MVSVLQTRKFHIFSTKSNMMVKVAWYFPKSEVVVHRCLQPLTGKYLFMCRFLIKTSAQMFSCAFFLIFENTVFAKHVQKVTASVKYLFVCYVDLSRKMLPSALAIFYLSLGYTKTRDPPPPPHPPSHSHCQNVPPLACKVNFFQKGLIDEK